MRFVLVSRDAEALRSGARNSRGASICGDAPTRSGFRAPLRRASASRLTKTRGRVAFTLLEVLLSSAIAILLLGALYVAMEVELRQAAEGRDLVERATVARAIINRLSIDITPSMSPRGAATSSSSSSSSTTGSTTGAAATATSGASTGTGSSTTNQTAQPTTMAIPLKSGVIGTSQVLIIFTTHVAGNAPIGQDSPDATVPSDIRRITYWLGTNGGLCRQEIPFFSSDDAQNNSTGFVPDGNKPEEDYLIAPEVSDLAFEYYDINTTSDGGGWNDTWTGSDPGLDGTTPKGPPTAIRVTFSVKTKNPNGRESSKQYRHVIALLTSSGPDSNADTTSTGGAMGATSSTN